MSRSETATTTERKDDEANGSQSANQTSRQSLELGGDQRRGNRCRKRRTLATLRPAADFLRCRDCTFVTTEQVRMSEHISSHSQQQQQQQGRQDHENSEEDQGPDSIEF